MEVNGQLHTPAALSPRKEPPYPLHRRLGGPQSWSGHNGGEEKKSWPHLYIFYIPLERAEIWTVC